LLLCQEDARDDNWHHIAVPWEHVPAMIDLAEYQFAPRLAGVLSPSRPIRTPEHLRGRERDLVTIKRALYATGRHIFIYGDRGVGKSSLAATAAYQYQSSDAEPIFIAGSLDETFNSLI